jgi:hypothetical protein
VADAELAQLLVAADEGVQPNGVGSADGDHQVAALHGQAGDRIAAQVDLVVEQLLVLFQAEAGVQDGEGERRPEQLQQENLVAYAAPEPGDRRRSKAEYELVAARLDRQLGLLNNKLRALSAPELPGVLTGRDLETEWAALPFYTRRRVAETLIARVTLFPVGRGCRQFDPSSVRIDWTF